MVELKYSQAMPGAYSYQGPVLSNWRWKREDDVVGVHLARRGEIVGGLELDARAQVEGDLGAVLGDVPALGEARLGLGRALLELDQPVVDGARRGVEGRPRGPGAGSKPSGDPSLQ